MAFLGAGAAAGSGFSWGTALSYAATAAAVAGAAQAGKANAQAAAYNAMQAQREAGSKENQIRQEAMRTMARTRASIAKSGATFEGTPLMALAESAANAEIDAINVRQGGDMESALYRMRGKQAMKTARYQAGTSLLSGMSRIA